MTNVSEKRVVVRAMDDWEPEESRGFCEDVHEFYSPRGKPPVVTGEGRRFGCFWGKGRKRFVSYQINIIVLLDFF